MAESCSRNIIVAVDKSLASEQACDWAAENLVRPGDMVYLVHVAALPLSEHEVKIKVSDIRPDETQHDAATRHIVADLKTYVEDRLVPHLRGAPYQIHIAGFHEFQAGKKAAGEVLCEQAIALGAEAVIVASHDQGAVKRFFLGSTSEYLSKHCPVPVVITR